MRTIIVGAGVVGSSLAEQLSDEGHQVAVLDTNRQLVADMNERLDVLAVAGNGALPSVLESVGIREADMVIAVTSVDEINLVVGMLANAYGVQHRIVRIRNSEYVHEDSVMSVSDLGIDHVVNPDPFIIKSLVKMINLPGSYDYAELAGGQVQMFGFHVSDNSPALGKSMAELRELGDLNAFLILYITRDGKVIVPRGDDRIERGDSVHLLVSSDTVDFLLPVIHPKPDSTDHVTIVGASRLGIALAEALQGRIDHLTLIEPNDTLAEEAARKLRDTNVIRGDATDLKCMEEASIDRCDLICAMSEDDHLNMLAALLAMRNGAAHAAVLVERPEFVPLLDGLGIDIVINPRLAVVSEILLHVRRGQILSVRRLAEGQGEVIEIEAPQGCAAVNMPLKKLKFPQHALVGAVVQDGVMCIPTGDTRIQPGDRVLVYALPDAIPRVEKLFAGAKTKRRRS